MKNATLLCLALGALATSSAQAQPLDLAPVSPWYVGFGGLRSDATIPPGSADAIDAAGAAFFASSFTLRDVDDRFAGWKVYLGYDFTSSLAVEIGATSMGTTSIGYNFLDAGLASVGSVVMRYNLSAAFVDAVGSFPIGDQWKLIGRVGASISRTRIEFASDTAAVLLTSNERTESDTQLHFGAGAQYDFTPKVGLRLEYERWKMPDPLSSDEVKVDSLAASIRVRF